MSYIYEMIHRIWTISYKSDVIEILELESYPSGTMERESGVSFTSAELS